VEGKLICPKCCEIDRYTQFIKAHTCWSFHQLENEYEGVCKNAIVCAPMKNALQSKPFIEPQLGHVICPYYSVNISFLTTNNFSKDLLETNYSEYLCTE